MIGVYKITSPTNKIYIGQSINIKKRWNYYKNLNCKNQTKLYNSLKKYGYESHIFEILEECCEEEILIKENYWKSYYQVLKFSSLCCRMDGRGGSLSEETKNKISESSKGKKHKEVSKLKMSLNHPFCKRIYQYNLKGDLIEIWPSFSKAQRENKGNIKNNILGKTKQAGGFIWLREEDLNFLKYRINKIKTFIHPNTNRIMKDSTKSLLSKNIKGKKIKLKEIYLLQNLKGIKEHYKTLTTGEIAKLYKVSFPTMLKFLKDNNIYSFRKNYK